MVKIRDDCGRQEEGEGILVNEQVQVVKEQESKAGLSDKIFCYLL